MKATTVQETSNNRSDSILPAVEEPTLESHQVLLERLFDSSEAFREVKALTDHMGAFIVCSRFRVEARKGDARSGSLGDHGSSSRTAASVSRKRKREDNQQNDQEAASAVNRNRRCSAKRMMFLYHHLQKTQSLFEAELGKFIDETEEEVAATLSQNESPTSCE